MNPLQRDLLRHSWSESNRFVPRAVVRPLQRFMAIEAAVGIVMLVAAVVALVWANSPLQDSYVELWETPFAVELGHSLHLDLHLRDWVNDGLMALFFFLAGLEIKRELVQGELRDPRAAALPVIAALGGMVVPALIYTAFNAGGDGAAGWGIPMATDIAFAVGIVALLGSRVPSGAKLFLLTLAIVDDLGAIVVIAVFYTSSLSFGWLAVAVGALAVAAVLRRLDVRFLGPYLALGVVCWFALHESGVHPTLAGVAFGLLTPTWSFYDPRHFGAVARPLVDAIDQRLADDTTADEHADNEATLAELNRVARETQSPLDRIEHHLAPWVGFGIVPVFALANAGVPLTGEALGGALGDRIVLGVGIGLVVGKTVGVFAATWLATRLGVGRLPTATTWAHIRGLAVTAGIGFTVALFVAGLSFDEASQVDSAKIGILGGSLVAGILGYLLLRASPPADETDPAVPAGDRERVPAA